MRALIFASMILMTACDAKAPPPVEPPPPPTGDEETVFDDAWTHANPGSKGPSVLNPSDADGKYGRRISIDELRRSIPALFDGITWTLRRGGRDVSAFDLF